MRSAWARPLVALSVVILAAAVLPAPPAEAHHRAPIQPGGMFYASGYACTFNFVFEDPQGALFIGTAAHCVGNVTTRIAAPGIGEFGTLVYRGNVTSANGGVAGNDFALIQIDADKYDLVDPSVRFWGGPLGVETGFLPGTPIVMHGQGLLVSSTEVPRTRAGVLHFAYGETGSTGAPPEYEGWYLASTAIMSGDSGGFIMTADGRAVGVTALPAFLAGEPGVVAGPTFAWILERLREDGFDVSLVTAPFHPTGPALLAAELQATAGHCLDEPYGNASGDACAKLAYPSWRVGEPGHWDDWSNATLLARGTILAGGPHAEHFTLGRNPVGGREVAGAADVDAFEFPAPEAGSIIGTRTEAGAGVDHDVDLHFWGRGGFLLGTPGCATEARDEVCTVPDRAVTVVVTALEGFNLDVSVYLLQEAPGEEGDDGAPGLGGDVAETRRVPAGPVPLFLAALAGLLWVGARRTRAGGGEGA